MAQNFSPEDIRFMESRGISPDAVNKQLENFTRGFPFVKLAAPATTKHGIFKLSKKRLDECIETYQNFAEQHKVVKFVPASGAASRMFKHLFEFRNAYRGTNEDQLLLLKDKGPDSVYYFFENLTGFPFYEELVTALEGRGYDIEKVIEESRYERILNSLLTEKGLNFSNLPKALIPFHQYEDSKRSAFAEHLFEGAVYARSANNKCHLHFTVSPEHLELIKKHYEEVKAAFEQHHHVNYEVEFSLQNSSTDIIAVDLNNEPARDEEGQLIFRPGGHGALLENLASLDADLIIIKNIDNVGHDRLKEDTYTYKQALAGYLVALQEQIFSFLRGLDNPTPPSSKVVEHIWSFMEHKLMIDPPATSKSWKKEEKIEYICHKLNRPIRICGMVENEGEPGGGPFWSRNPDGSLSLQIIETSQIDQSDEEQMSILEKSTHFNPVDLVCSTRDYLGNIFDLNQFVDPDTGFISKKSAGGKEIKVQELPGLWNGSMANWITVFVEVPLTTFNPVKTINDLLRSEHQSYI